MNFNKIRKIKLIICSIILLTLIFALIGCSESSEEPLDSEEEAVENIPENQEKEKILRYALVNTPYLDPAVGTDEASSSVFPNIYDTLVFPQTDGTMKPWVATEWQVSEDDLEWTFKLREDVVFHNGDNLTAEDVVFSMERLLEVGEGFGYLYEGRIKTLEAVEDYEFKITLNEPFGPLIPSLVRLYIVNKSQVLENIKDGPYGDFGDYGKEWLRTNDAGSGPYITKEYKQDQYYIAEKFNDYWDGFDDNNPDEFKLIALTEPVTIRSMIEREELEISDPYQPEESYQAMSKMEGVYVARYFDGSIMSLTLNNMKAPTDDIHFRKAIAYSINYDSIVNEVFPGAKRLRSVVSEAVAGYNPDVFNFEYNEEKAIEELKKSKYYDKLDNYPLELAWVAETPDREKIALSIQASAQRVGFNVEVIKIPWLSLVEGATKPETTPGSATILTTPHYSEAGSQLESRFMSKSVGSWEQCEWYHSQELDRKIKDALSTSNLEERLEEYKNIQEEIMEDVPTIPLFENPIRLAYQDSYLEWETGEKSKNNEPVTPVMGYHYYMRDIRFTN